MALPIFSSEMREMTQMQTQWAQSINPVLDLPINNGTILTSITLAVGSNTVNHLLGRKLRGWFIVRQRSAATVYDTQDSNTTPKLTLLLTSSAIVVVDIFVF